MLSHRSSFEIDVRSLGIEVNSLHDRCTIAAKLLWNGCRLSLKSLRNRCAIAARTQRKCCAIAERSLWNRCEIAVQLLYACCAIADRCAIVAKSQQNCCHAIAVRSRGFAVQLFCTFFTIATLSQSICYHFTKALESIFPGNLLKQVPELASLL
jgi:hypothetical protein